MRHVIALAPLTLATLISACYPGYGEVPGAGTTSLATIQEGFSENFFTGPAPTGEPDYLAWAAFYDPAPGQICMLYGVVRGSLDGSETYTAQVFSGTTALGESYFYGAMFKYNSHDRVWDRFANYQYYPTTYPGVLEVQPLALPKVSLGETENNMQEFIFDLDKCKLFQADSTYVPPPTEEEP